jgi:hypothetical protein
MCAEEVGGSTFLLYWKWRETTSAPSVSVSRRLGTRIMRSVRSEVLILGDSHLKGCTERINNHLGDTFRMGNCHFGCSVMFCVVRNCSHSLKALVLCRGMKMAN